MGSGTVFERYEIKYIITEKQKELIKNGMEKYMAPDKYGRSVIRNIYYDTADSRLIRRSNENPYTRKNFASEVISVSNPMTKRCLLS